MVWRILQHNYNTLIDPMFWRYEIYYHLNNTYKCCKSSWTNSRYLVSTDFGKLLTVSCTNKPGEMVGAPAAVIIIYWRLNCYHQAELSSRTVWSGQPSIYSGEHHWLYLQHTYIHCIKASWWIIRYVFYTPPTHMLLIHIIAHPKANNFHCPGCNGSNAAVFSTVASKISCKIGLEWTINHCPCRMWNLLSYSQP